MRAAAWATVLWASGAVALAAGPPQDKGTISAYLRQAPAYQYYLPAGLSEVSGLLWPPIFGVAHDDNYGIVYEVVLGSKRAVRAFALGKPTVKEDFEDIVARGNHVYLLTSDGRIFEAPVGENRKRVLYNAYDTGVGAHCETEGLASGPAEGDFLILCKKPHEAELKDRLVIYLWNLRDRVPVAKPWLDVSLDGLVEKLDQANFHPSAFIWRRERGTLVVISAKGHLAIEVDQQGHLIDRVKLDKKLHPQPEGLTQMPDGRLIVSDEGPRGHGMISVYNPPR